MYVDYSSYLGTQATRVFRFNIVRRRGVLWDEHVLNQGAGSGEGRTAILSLFSRKKKRRRAVLLTDAAFLSQQQQLLLVNK